MKKLVLLIGLVLTLSTSAMAQKVAVKTNLVGWAAMGTTNLGVEAALWPKLTLDVGGYYNPFRYELGEQTELWGVQPELRYWFCGKFAGSFVGLHGLFSEYDYGRKKYRYDGWMTGAGLSYGYSLPIAKRWRIEASLGLGWQHKEYQKMELPLWSENDINWIPDTNGSYDFVKDSFGLTKAALNIVFIIR